MTDVHRALQFRAAGKACLQGLRSGPDGSAQPGHAGGRRGQRVNRDDADLRHALSGQLGTGAGAGP